MRFLTNIFLLVLLLGAVFIGSKNPWLVDWVGSMAHRGVGILPSLIPSTASSTSSVKTATSTGGTPAVLLVNETSAIVIDEKGKSHRETLAAFSARAASLGIDPVGAEVGTGAISYSTFSPLATTRGSFVSPNGKFTAQMAASTGDQASVVELRHGTDPVQRIVLRVGGQAVHDAAIYGWTDDGRMLMVGMASSSRAAYVMTTAGGLSLLAPIPDTAVMVEARVGKLWYVTAQQGQGLESPPTGPSELHMLASTAAADGSHDSLVATCGGSCVIQSFVATRDTAPHVLVAYQTDAGEMVLVDGGLQTGLGRGRPLLFLPGGELLVRRNYNLEVDSTVSATTTDLGALPEGHVEVYPIARYTAP